MQELVLTKQTTLVRSDTGTTGSNIYSINKNLILKLVQISLIQLKSISTSTFYFSHSKNIYLPLKSGWLDFGQQKLVRNAKDFLLENFKALISISLSLTE